MNSHEFEETLKKSREHFRTMDKMFEEMHDNFDKMHKNLDAASQSLDRSSMKIDSANNSIKFLIAICILFIVYLIGVGIWLAVRVF